jgi:hypothetical protein
LKGVVNLKEESETEKLKRYVESLRKQGLNDTEISKKLEEKGLDKDALERLYPEEHTPEERKYKSLRIYTNVYAGCGLLLIVGGIIYLFVNPSMFIISIILVVIGLSGLAMNNLAELLINLEDNTYQTKLLLQKLIKKK